MAERGDFFAVHEPFSYLAEFGTITVGDWQAATESELLAVIRAAAAQRPVFFKDTTDERYPGLLADERFLAEDATHTFIIRHPRETIASYHALNQEVASHQIGFESQYEIFSAVQALTGVSPVVIDADDLLRAPAAVVRAYCARMSIPYLPETLSWQPVQRQEWQPSARWHADVSRSSGFHREATEYEVDVAQDPRLGAYLRHHLPFYERLREHRLVVEPDGSDDVL